MLVEDFPRPKNDNRRGVHWSASVYHFKGKQLDRWIDELQAMHIKWVKVLDDSGGSSLELCRRLVAADIYPVVRLYRSAPNPGRISARETDTVRAMVQSGVYYFETNNEPDLHLEWKNGRIPEDWLDVVVDNFIFDADHVLAAGGLPALPAMGVGSKDNALERLVARGRADLFAKGAWIAIHNYTLNHPLDYPADPVNQQGEPVGEEEFERLGPWAWDRHPRSLVNEWRARDKNPGDTLADDPACFMAWKLADEQATRALGHPVPIISTEGGPLIGSRDDRRYPRLTAAMHAEWVVAINDFMQGNRPIAGVYCPNNYFAMCHWLLGNQHLGFFNITWESQSWFTDWWNTVFETQGHLPVVEAVQAMPNLPVDKLGSGLLTGLLLRADSGEPLPGLRVDLLLSAKVAATAVSGADGEFRLEAVPPGDYDLAVLGYGVVERAIPVRAQARAPLVLRLVGGQRSTLSGIVLDRLGAPKAAVHVTLQRDGYVVAEADTSAEGIFRFAGLPFGCYQICVPGVTVAGIALDGWLSRTIKLTVAPPLGYRYVVTRRRLLAANEPGQRNAFYGTVTDRDGQPLNGIKLRMSWRGAGPDASFPVVVTGQDSYKPAGYYQFTHTRGLFQVQVVQNDWPSDLADNLDTARVPGREGEEISYEVNFQLQGLPGPTRLEGQAPGAAPGTRLVLSSLADGEPEGRPDAQESRVGSDGRFAYDLAPGRYQLALDGCGVIAPAIRLDAGTLFTLIFPMRSRLAGRVQRAPAGAVARLFPPAPWDWTRTSALDASGAFAFEGLPAGRYRLEVADASIAGLQLNGESPLNLAPIVAGQARGLPQAVLRGKLTAADGTPQVNMVVRLLQDGVDVKSTQTNASGDYRLCALEAAEYALAVGDAAPLAAGIRVAPGAMVAQDLSLPAGGAKLFTHYLLFGRAGPGAAESGLAYELALPYLVRSGASAGFSLDEAKLAARVTIVGDLVPAEAETILASAGCRVERLVGDGYALAVGFDRLLAGIA